MSGFTVSKTLLAEGESFRNSSDFGTEILVIGKLLVRVFANAVSTLALAIVFTTLATDPKLYSCSAQGLKRRKRVTLLKRYGWQSS